MPMLVHPYTDLTGGHWLRGNLHAHSTRSDGSRSPHDVIAAYAALGHGFLMLSDHDTLASPDLYSALDPHGLILIPGNEISANGSHLLHVNAPALITPHPQRQRVMNEASAAGGFIIANHPNWYANFNHATIDQLRGWTGYLGMEIYNGVIGELDGTEYALDKWDMLLAEGRRIWGFAHDDSHGKPAQYGLGWNVAYITQPTVAGLIDALARGRFYASTGVTISALRVTGLTIRIETHNALRIVALRETGRRCAVADAPALEFTAPPDARYLRFECWGPGERFAWTQPFFLIPD